MIRNFIKTRLVTIHECHLRVHSKPYSGTCNRTARSEMHLKKGKSVGLVHFTSSCARERCPQVRQNNFIVRKEVIVRVNGRGQRDSWHNYTVCFSEVMSHVTHRLRLSPKQILTSTAQCNIESLVKNNEKIITLQARLFLKKNLDKKFILSQCNAKMPSKQNCETQSCVSSPLTSCWKCIPSVYPQSPSVRPEHSAVSSGRTAVCNPYKRCCCWNAVAIADRMTSLLCNNCVTLTTSFAWLLKEGEKGKWFEQFL